MKVAVRIRTSHLSDALRAYVQRRLQFSIARFADRLHHVSARVSDTGGASPERLYVCHLEVEIRPSGGSHVEEVADADLYTAIDLAADRLGRALRRTLAHSGAEIEARAWPRRHPRGPVDSVETPPPVDAVEPLR